MSFIGNSVMELLVHEKDSPKITDLIRSARMVHMHEFNIFRKCYQSKEKEEKAPSIMAKNMSILRGRARFCATKADSYNRKRVVHESSEGCEQKA